MLRTRQALLGAALLAVTISALPASAVAKPEPTRPLEQVVADAVVTRIGKAPATIAAAGRTFQVAVQRSDATGAWAFGVATLRAPAKEGEYPEAWLFLAQRQSGQWSVALESSQGFIDLARRAPASVFSAEERATFESAWQANSRASLQALSNNTGLRLPYAIGATWNMGGGPHGWAGSDTPYSSVDLNGGDGIVRAAGGGTVYTMCADTSNGGTPGGWRRVYHPSGYTTDYYHMWNLTALTPGSTISEGTALGNIGTNLCNGGSASGAHVHWGILSGTTRVAWHWRSAGKWVFWAGGAPYGGYALHGSTQQNPGTGLYNYGALGSNQGIADANGGGTVNKRSGPGTGYPVVGSVADGTTLTISCWRNGTTHTGRWGTTALWNKLTDGTWVSDAFVYTGVTSIGPNC